MREPKQTLPLAEDHGEELQDCQIDWDGMFLSYHTFPKGVDATPLCGGPPNDLGQSDHWGFVLKGRVRVKRSNGEEEVLQTGGVYHLEPGHVPIIEEDSEILEISPKAENQETLDMVACNMADLQEPE